ncbi:hypothetical protein GCM10027517_30380 [Phycicoccus ginsengisoli]
MGEQRRRARWLVGLAVLGLVLAVGLAVWSRSGSQDVAARHTLVAQAVSTAGPNDLRAVEAELVGADAVGDPASGRLPSVDAFHRKGIESVRIDNGRVLTVVLLPDASPAQEAAARSVLLASRQVASLVDGRAPSVTAAPQPVVAAGQLATTVGRALTSTGGPPGVLMMVSTPSGAFAAGLGVADRSTGLAMSPALPYRVGSTSKTFTAVVVLQLVQEGRVGLDEPVSTYLPGLLPYPQPITVRELLGHTSGLVDASHFGPGLDLVPARDAPRVRDPALRAQALRALAGYRAGRPVVTTPAVQVAVATTRPLAFAPGSRFTYSNTDYHVLTMLVEKVTGHSLAAELASRVLDPLGLRHTFLAATTRMPVPSVHSYVGEQGRLVDATDDLAFGPSGASTVVSTMADLTTFLRALLGGGLLQPSMLREMTTPTPGSSLSDVMTAYGLGLTRYETPAGSRPGGTEAASAAT